MVATFSTTPSSSLAGPRRASDTGPIVRAGAASPLGLITRNAPLVVLGEVVPLAAAVVAMPLLLSRLGVDRLGVLSLAWVVIGYFSLFDLGIGRATTQMVASRLADGRGAQVPGVVRTSLALLLLLGCAGGALLASLAPWLVERVLQVPVDLTRETRTAFLLLALTVPLVVVGSGLRGVLEAERRFAAVATLRAALGLVSFLGPLAVAPFAPTLPAVVLVLAAGRVVLFLAALVLCRGTIALRGERPDRAAAGELLRFGGWLTVSNAVSPLLVLLDRFVVGAVVSVGAVAFYATPLEVVQRAGVVPIAIGTVLFPAMAASAFTDPRHARDLFATALRLCPLGVYPILMLLVLWSHEGLDLWLGPAFARESSAVVRWIAPGLLLNALACASLFALQASGRPDLPAKFHVLELIGYVPLLWWLAGRYGLEGAAMAWTARVALDALLLVAAALQRFPLAPPALLRLVLATSLGLASIGVASAIEATAVKLAVTVLVATALVGLGPRLLAAAHANEGTVG